MKREGTKYSDARYEERLYNEHDQRLSRFFRLKLLLKGG
jgi:hypothetical protein